MFHSLKDHRTPRRWSWIWKDAPGLICCCTGGPATYMYALGGADGTLMTTFNTCDKVNLVGEASAAVSSGNLSLNRFGAAGVANPTVAGYVCGGATGASATVAIADKLVFASDTASGLASANLSAAREQIGAVSERISKGYLAGGGTPGTKLATADKIAFSTDTSGAQSSANLTLARIGAGGMNGDPTKGYFSGGSPSGVTNCVSTVEKLLFASDATAGIGTALHIKKEQMGPGSDGSTKGYWHGGQTSNGTDGGVDKMTVATDTDSSLGLNSNSQCTGAPGSDGNKLVHIGGSDVSGVTVNGRKVTFSTDAEAAFGGALSQARQLVAGLSQAAL